MSNIMWIIKTPEGEMVSYSVRHLIGLAVHVFTEAVGEDWDSLYKKGYRAVRVKLEEINE